MDDLITKLKDIVKSASDFCCYAINTKKHPIVGTKVELSNKQLSEFMIDAIDYLCEKKYTKNQLGDFPVASPKDYIERLLRSDARINNFIEAIEKMPLTPELNNSDLKYYNAYFILLYVGDRRYFFITKKNVFVSFKKKFMYQVKKETFQRLSDKIVNLTKHFDTFIVDDNCYIVTEDGKSLLGLEQDLVKKSNEIKEELFVRNILSEKDQNTIEAYMKKSGKAKCFAHTDEDILRDLESITNENKDSISQKYRLPVITTSEGDIHVDVSSGEKLKDFIDTITRKRCLDFNNCVVGCTAPFIPRS